MSIPTHDMGVNPAIFNTMKTDYATSASLFLSQELGLIDTINKHHPEIDRLYLKLKAQDWDRDEFDYSSCNAEFKKASRSSYDIMIRTLAWQWEADSAACRTILPIMAPFIANSDLHAAWALVTANEVLHAQTYSEIIKNSFDDPEEVMSDILAVRESLERLGPVALNMGKSHDVSHRVALGAIARNSPEAYDAAMKFTVTLWALERIQFIASFAITFAFGEAGDFMPIAKGIQKICVDELEVHAVLDRYIVLHELSTLRGRDWYNENKDSVKEIIDSVVDTELNWVDYLFSGGRELTGVTPEMLKSLVLYNSADLYNAFDIELREGTPTQMPIGYMDKWVKIDSFQPSPMEQRPTAYMLGAIKKDIDDNVPIDY